MRILQVLPSLSYGDAIGNDAFATETCLKKNGYNTGIYAGQIDRRLPKGCAASLSELDAGKDDLILYHLSTGDDYIAELKKSPARLAVIYHNITPSEFFRSFDRAAERSSENALRQAASLTEKAECCIADSEYNKRDLVRLGFTCPIYTVPLLIDFDSYGRSISDEALRKTSAADGAKTILFVGRVAPNKKHEDLIRSFFCYQKHIEPKSRLVLVGGYSPEDAYYRRLSALTKALGAENVIFTGHIPFEEILAWYKNSDLFLCLSEHEGFCVPLVEAMYFGKPVVALDAAAVGETAGDAALLLEDKDPRIVAEAMNAVLDDRELAESLTAKGRERLKAFDHDRIEAMLLEVIKNLISKG